MYVCVYVFGFVLSLFCVVACFDVGVCGNIGGVASSFNYCTRLELGESTTSKQMPLPCLV